MAWYWLQQFTVLLYVCWARTPLLLQQVMFLDHSLEWRFTDAFPSLLIYMYSNINYIGLFVLFIYKNFHCVWSCSSVLWCCWLGGRKGIRPVKNWAVGCWRGYMSGARCRLIQLMPLPLTVSCFSKIQIGLPFWYRPTRAVLDKGPLNGCVCVGAAPQLAVGPA